MRHCNVAPGTVFRQAGRTGSLSERVGGSLSAPIHRILIELTRILTTCNYTSVAFCRISTQQSPQLHGVSLCAQASVPLAYLLLFSTNLIVFHASALKEYV